MTKSKKLAAVFGVLQLAWLWFVFSNSLKSKKASAAQSAPLQELVTPPIKSMGVNNADRVAELVVRKSAHMAEFFVLTLLCCFVFCFLGKKPKTVLGLSAIFATVTACIDETLQIFSQRGAAVTDVFIDLIGVVLAISAFFTFYKIKNKRQNKNRNV